MNSKLYFSIHALEIKMLDLGRINTSCDPRPRLILPPYSGMVASQRIAA